MLIEFSRKHLKIIYLLFILLDLFFMTILFLDWQNIVPPTDATMGFIRTKLDLKNECNLASWYSSLVFLFPGLAAFLNLLVNPFQSKQKWMYRSGWFLIGCLFIMISGDETAQIHESIATLVFLSKSPDNRSQIQVGAGDWIPILFPFIVGAVLLLISFVVYTFWQRKLLMSIGLIGVFCWIGAIVSESIEGNIIHVTMSRPLEGLIEESLELIGATLLLIAFTEHYQWRQKNNLEMAEAT